MRSGGWWPLGLTAVLAVTVVANGFMLYAANDRNAAVVEPDYYRRAVAWDSSAVQLDVNAALGWRIEASIEPLAEDGRGRIRVRLADRDGRPLARARLAVTAIHNLDAARRPAAEIELDDEGAGILDLPLGRAGMWELRFVALAHGARFTTSLRRDAAFAPLAAGS
jgi:nitrogen fixation protein FixH